MSKNTMTPEEIANEINSSEAFVIYEQYGDVCDMCGRGDQGVHYGNTQNRMICYTDNCDESWQEDHCSDGILVVGPICWKKVKNLITKKPQE